MQKLELRNSPKSYIEPVPGPNLTPELRQFLLPLWNWWWALLIVPLLCGGIAYKLMDDGPYFYQARSVLQFGTPLGQASNQLPYPPIPILGPTYVNMITSDEFLGMVLQKARTNQTIGELRQAVVPYHQYWSDTIEIQIIDSNQARTLLLLDTIDGLLINETPQLSQLRLQFITQRQAALQKQNRDYENQLNTLNAQGIGPNGQSLEDAIIDIRNSISTNNQEYNNLSLYLSLVGTYELHVEVAPQPVNIALGPRASNAVPAMAAIGLALLLVVIALVEKVKDRIYTVRQIESITGQPAAAVLKSRHRTQEKSLDLLASEIAASHYLENNTLRLLVFTDRPAPKADATGGADGAEMDLTSLPVVAGLAAALTRLGIRTKVTRNWSRGNVKDQALEPVYKAKSGPTRVPRCTLVVQTWSVISGAPNAANLGAYYSEAIVLINLKRSKKTELRRLYESLVNHRLNIKNVIEV